MLPRRGNTRRSKKTPYVPKKYFRGLSRRNKTIRKREIQKYGSLHWRDPAAYKGFKTDMCVRTKPSSYTTKWKTLYPDAKSLEQKSKVTGVPLKYIKESYDRGMAAWRTGHRPGATQQQWGYARVHSFLLKGTTYDTTDADLVRAAKAASPTSKKYWDSF
jgi:hypothetical protein